MDKSLIILVKKPSPQQMLVEDNVNKPDITDDELLHYGIPGMKWYVRRFQNRDGTLTALGKARLATLRAKNPKMAKYFEVSALENVEKIKKKAAKKRKASLKKAQKALKEKQLHESEAYKKKMAKKEAKAEARERRKEERRLERKRLKEERRLERKEEQKRLREEAANERRRENDNQREQNNYQREQVDPQIEKLKKRYIKMGPKAVAKHIDLYNYKELQNITSRFEAQEKLGKLRSDRGQRRQDDINRIIKYGNTLNNAINFLNSPGGKLIRKYMGDSNYKENVANFKQPNAQNNQNNQNNNQNGMSNKDIMDLLNKINKQMQESNKSELDKEKKKRH